MNRSIQLFSCFAIAALSSMASAQSVKLDIPVGSTLVASPIYRLNIKKQHDLIGERFVVGKDGKVKCYIGLDDAEPSADKPLLHNGFTVEFVNEHINSADSKSNNFPESSVNIGFKNSLAILKCESYSRKVTTVDIHDFMSKLINLRFTAAPPGAAKVEDDAGSAAR